MFLKIVYFAFVIQTTTATPGLLGGLLGGVGKGLGFGAKATTVTTTTTTTTTMKPYEYLSDIDKLSNGFSDQTQKVQDLFRVGTTTESPNNYVFSAPFKVISDQLIFNNKATAQQQQQQQEEQPIELEVKNVEENAPALPSYPTFGNMDGTEEAASQTIDSKAMRMSQSVPETAPALPSFPTFGVFGDNSQTTTTTTTTKAPTTTTTTKAPTTTTKSFGLSLPSLPNIQTFGGFPDLSQTTTKVPTTTVPTTTTTTAKPFGLPVPSLPNIPAFGGVEISIIPSKTIEKNQFGSTSQTQSGITLPKFPTFGGVEETNQLGTLPNFSTFENSEETENVNLTNVTGKGIELPNLPTFGGIENFEEVSDTNPSPNIEFSNFQTPKIDPLDIENSIANVNSDLIGTKSNTTDEESNLEERQPKANLDGFLNKTIPQQTDKDEDSGFDLDASNLMKTIDETQAGLLKELQPIKEVNQSELENPTFAPINESIGIDTGLNQTDNESKNALSENLEKVKEISNAASSIFEETEDVNETLKPNEELENEGFADKNQTEEGKLIDKNIGVNLNETSPKKNQTNSIKIFDGLASNNSKLNINQTSFDKEPNVTTSSTNTKIDGLDTVTNKTILEAEKIELDPILEDINKENQENEDSIDKNPLSPIFGKITNELGTDETQKETIEELNESVNEDQNNFETDVELELPDNEEPQIEDLNESIEEPNFENEASLIQSNGGNSKKNESKKDEYIGETTTIPMEFESNDNKNETGNLNEDDSNNENPELLENAFTGKNNGTLEEGSEIFEETPKNIEENPINETLTDSVETPAPETDFGPNFENFEESSVNETFTNLEETPEYLEESLETNNITNLDGNTDNNFEETLTKDENPINQTIIDIDETTENLEESSVIPKGNLTNLQKNISNFEKIPTYVEESLLNNEEPLIPGQIEENIVTSKVNLTSKNDIQNKTIELEANSTLPSIAEIASKIIGKNCSLCGVSYEETGIPLPVLQELLTPHSKQEEGSLSVLFLQNIDKTDTSNEILNSISQDSNCQIKYEEIEVPASLLETALNSVAQNGEEDIKAMIIRQDIPNPQRKARKLAEKAKAKIPKQTAKLIEKTASSLYSPNEKLSTGEIFEQIGLMLLKTISIWE